MDKTQQKPKKSHLKPKEKEFAIKYVKNNENLTKTGQEVFKIEDPNYAHVKATRMIQKDIVVKEIEVQRETLKSALENQGITPTKIAEKVSELLEASEPIFKNNNSTGEIEQVGEKKDYTAIDKGLKHATAIYGVENPEDKPKSQNTYNFIFNSETQQNIKELEDKIKARLAQGNV